MGFIVKNTTFLGLAELVCPNSCRGCGALGRSLCECCKKDLCVGHANYCLYCKEPRSGGEKCPFCGLESCYMVGWRDELVGKLVHDLKYRSRRELGGILAEVLDEILPEISGEVAIVPLPTIAKHVRERGLDHTKLIARVLARKRGWKVETGLRRAKNTVQVGNDEATRRAQAKEAYVFEGEIKPGTTYLLFDDVWTTGASMRAALKKLREAGALKVILVVLAVNRVGKK